MRSSSRRKWIAELETELEIHRRASELSREGGAPKRRFEAIGVMATDGQAELTLGLGIHVEHNAVEMLEMLMRRAGLKGLPGNRRRRPTGDTLGR